MSTIVFLFLIAIIIQSNLALEKPQQEQAYNYTQLRDRPEPSKRKFVSTIIDEVTTNITGKLKDSDLAKMFNQCFPNTLDTTVESFTDIPDYDTFIITGDIDAMWLRDSTNQVMPYIQFASQDQHLKNMLVGLIKRQIDNLKQDTYANAFNKEANGKHCDSGDVSTKIDNTTGKQVNGITAWLWERKYEIDSTAAVLKLVVEYYNATQDSTVINQDFLLAVDSILDMYQEQQLGTADEDQLNRVAYTFQRTTNQPTDTLSHGRGPMVRATGLIRSSFRPSDDACTFPFLIPSNAMASTYLNRTAQIIRSIYPTSEHDSGSNNDINSIASDVANRAGNMSVEIKNAIYQYGITYDSQGRKIFAYEVDGYGGVSIMDDANLPSLLSLPIIGFVDVNDPIYQNTRQLLLSSNNQYFFKGTAGEGIGGPHVGDKYIWPMSIISRAMTSTDDEEIQLCLYMLKTTTASTYFMHESFNKDNATDYTRAWFAWANTYFGELILYLAKTKPYLIFNTEYSLK